VEIQEQGQESVRDLLAEDFLAVKDDNQGQRNKNAATAEIDHSSSIVQSVCPEILRWESMLPCDYKSPSVSTQSGGALQASAGEECGSSAKGNGRCAITRKQECAARA